MKITHIRKQGIPRRRHALGYSVQKNGSLVRKKVFSAMEIASYVDDHTFFDIHIENCYLTIFLILLTDIIGDDGLPKFFMLVEELQSMVCNVEITHIRKHGIPRRRHALGYSMQKNKSCAREGFHNHGDCLLRKRPDVLLMQSQLFFHATRFSCLTVFFHEQL